MFEDRVFAIRYYGAGGQTRRLDIYKKLRFDGDLSTYMLNEWTAGHGMAAASIDQLQRPLFTSWTSDVSGNSIVCRYTPNLQILSAGSSLAGLQLFHFPHINQNIHRSVDMDCDSPSSYHYTQNAQTPGSWETS